MDQRTDYESCLLFVNLKSYLLKCSEHYKTFRALSKVRVNRCQAQVT